MTDETSMDRRSVLGTTAALLAGGALAGCTSGGQNQSPTADSGGDGGRTPRGFGGWLSDTDDYDGVVDETGSSQVTVSVGAQGNGGAFAFDPVAVRVASGTTVVWEWTGDGGTHNVVDQDGAFESQLTKEAGETFEHTFETGDIYKYLCAPHESLGMKGVVVVG